MRIFTIGSNRKSAETFFELLRNNDVRFLLDIRLRNTSQLAGFARGTTLNTLLKSCLAYDTGMMSGSHLMKVCLKTGNQKD